MYCKKYVDGFVDVKSSDHLLIEAKMWLLLKKIVFIKIVTRVYSRFKLQVTLTIFNNINVKKKKKRF